MLRIARYKHTRHWAVWEGADLVVVTVYRRGALEVLRRLQTQEPVPAAGLAAPAAAAARPTARQPPARP